MNVVADAVVAVTTNKKVLNFLEIRRKIFLRLIFVNRRGQVV